jgi:hypothetical protein
MSKNDIPLEKTPHINASNKKSNFASLKWQFNTKFAKKKTNVKDPIPCGGKAQ